VAWPFNPAMLAWLTSDRAIPVEQELPSASRQAAQRRQIACALDAVGHLLRTFGELSFDIDLAQPGSLRGECEQWARHLLVGAEHPDGPAVERSVPRRRDWLGVRHFFAARRRAEVDFVRRMRGLILDTVERVTEAFMRAERTDDKLRAELVALREAAPHSTLVELRAHVDRTVTAAEDALDKRRSKRNHEVQQLGERMRVLRDELQAARRQATTDPLTQLNNRAALDAHLSAVTELAGYTLDSVALLMVDIDHFKRINDEFGHPVGDAALREVADCLVRVASRRSDFVARFGGEEFAIVLSDTPSAGARRVAQRMVDAVQCMHGDALGPDIHVTISAGVAMLRAGEQVAAWLQRADQALYRAKEEGRNRWVAAD